MIQAMNMTRLCGSRIRRTRPRNAAWAESERRDPTHDRSGCRNSHRTKAMPDEKFVLGIASFLATVLLWERTQLFSKELAESCLTPMPSATSTLSFAKSFSSQGSENSTPEFHSDHCLQRANGSCRIVLTGSQSGTRIVEVFERSPIRVMFPRTAGHTVGEAVLINTAGGIAGGDRLEFSVRVLADASIAVTSQAAEKVYRALEQAARITTKLKAAEGAKLAWLPQETIVFNRARISRETEIDLTSGAQLLALEWLLLGRAAHGEEMRDGRIADSWRVKKDGRLIWGDTFRATNEIFPQLGRKALLSDCKAIATLLYFGPNLDTTLEILRDLAPSLGCQCAATLVSGLMAVRFAATDSSDLRLALRTVLQLFGRELGPGPFRVPKMWSC